MTCDMALYRTLHKPRVAIRAEPRTSAEIAHVLAEGEVAELRDGWVRLAEDEAWARAIPAGFVLMDGAEVGSLPETKPSLGKLIEPLDRPDEELWPFTAAFRRARELGVPFAPKDAGERSLRPMGAGKLETSWLSCWHSPSCEWPKDLRTGHAQLAVAALLRGATPGVVQSFATQYHLSIGFQLILLYFDAPEDPSELASIQAAEQLSGAGVIVQRCTEKWWRQLLHRSRFHARQSQGEIYAEMMQLWELGDVQSRQCLAMEAALEEAQRSGMDWLLHIDVDEALLLPRHADARRFFAALPQDVEQVVFNNLEAVPESLEVKDWFEEVSLFKVHQNLLRESGAEKPSGKRYLEKLERWRQRQIAKGTDPEDVQTNRSFDMALLPVRLARRPTVQRLRLELPPLEEEDAEPFDSDEESARRPQLEDLPCYFTAYSNGKAACRLKQPLPLPVGVHRFASDENQRLSSMRCSGDGAPVVLHYANCGHEAWLRKYRILASGHGTEETAVDGGFSVERKGIKSMRAHLAHRALQQRSPEELQLPLGQMWDNRAQESRTFLIQPPSLFVFLGAKVTPGMQVQAVTPEGFTVQAVVPLGVEPGQQFAVQYCGHVVAFATSSCVLASVSKNALGLCFMGCLAEMRLLKMKDCLDSRASSERHPLESSASEGMVWRWMPYTPGGPPLHSPGEFSVPIDQGEVDAILEAAEKGRPVPVFTQNVAKKAASSDGFAKKKEEGNALFKAGDFVKARESKTSQKFPEEAVAAYDSALAEPAPDGEAAVAHSNAAQALLKLADAEAGDRRKACAAEALRRAREAIQLDPTNIKALARCAAACDLLGEAEAAAEFRQHQQGCEAACEATRAARRAEVERQQRAQEEQKQRLAAAREETRLSQREEERLEALMRRERALEQQRREVEETQANEATATRLSAMLGMGSLAGVGKA
ncbi:unnamed protein product [Effrenium voratum]|nr:unnamed protein product [Effrenium voratum]